MYVHAARVTRSYIWQIRFLIPIGRKLVGIPKGSLKYVVSDTGIATHT